MLNQRI